MIEKDGVLFVGAIVDEDENNVGHAPNRSEAESEDEVGTDEKSDREAEVQQEVQDDRETHCE